MERIEFTPEQDLQKTLENLRILIGTFIATAAIAFPALPNNLEFPVATVAFSGLFALKYHQVMKDLRLLQQSQTPATTEQTPIEPNSGTPKSAELLPR